MNASKKEDSESINKNDTSKKMSVERVYQKKTQLEHILLRPDTYIGSVEPLTQVGVTKFTVLMVFVGLMRKYLFWLLNRCISIFLSILNYKVKNCGLVYVCTCRKGMR